MCQCHLPALEQWVWCPPPPDPLSAELWLLNSCTVKGPSEDALLNAVRRGRELGRQVVVAGCVPQGQRDHPQLVGVSVVGVQQIDRVVEVVEETLQGRRGQGEGQGQQPEVADRTGAWHVG